MLTYLAALSSAFVVCDRAGIPLAVADQTGVCGIDRYSAVLEHESGNADVSDLLKMIKDRVRITQMHECAQIRDVRTDIDVFELIFTSLDLLVEIIAVGTCRHAIDLDHGLFPYRFLFVGHVKAEMLCAEFRKRTVRLFFSDHFVD